jgi:hypothetical protein
MSHHKVLAKIHWIPSSQGGRKYPPTGPQYSTVAHFEKTAAMWPREACSIVAEFIKETDDVSAVLAELRFLSPNAPSDLLETSSKFELFEGHRKVAHGEVLRSLDKAEVKTTSFVDESSSHTVSH